jgi:hypothetical protein
MYGWAWRHLPGGVAARIALLVLLLVLAGLLLWLAAYPWASVHLPIDRAGIGLQAGTG